MWFCISCSVCNSKMISGWPTFTNIMARLVSSIKFMFCFVYVRHFLDSYNRLVVDPWRIICSLNFRNTCFLYYWPCYDPCHVCYLILWLFKEFHVFAYVTIVTAIILFLLYPIIGFSIEESSKTFLIYSSWMSLAMFLV